MRSSPALISRVAWRHTMAKALWVSKAAIPSGDADWPIVRDSPGGPRVAINRSSFIGASFWSLRRTARRLRKYAARGLAVPPEDADWLEAELLARAAAPDAVSAACQQGRLQETVALLRAGAAPMAAGSALWHPSSDTHTDSQAAAFLAAVEKSFSSPRATTAARALVSASCVSHSFSRALTALPRDLSRYLASFLCGSDSESFPEAAAAAREEWTATDAAFAAAIARPEAEGHGGSGQLRVDYP